MSVNYADGLSSYDNKGVCGIPEIFDDSEIVEESVKKLAEWIQNASYVVVHCGAGISTSAGIPDFRGPKGVWTKEKNGTLDQKEEMVRFEDAEPTPTHMALLSLLKHDKIQFIISQNVDGLFLKTGISRSNIAELHGNFFLSECTTCKQWYVRNTASNTMGRKISTIPCPRGSEGVESKKIEKTETQDEAISILNNLKSEIDEKKSPDVKVKPKKNNSNSACRGHLRDTILDWEHSLPQNELSMSERNSRKADLSICLGTTMQIEPAGSLPFKHRNKRKVAIVNLQPTKKDPKADLVIHHYVDDVMVALCRELGIVIEKYDPSTDPTKSFPHLQVPWTRKKLHNTQFTS